MFKKVLIANRGEIACRIIKTLKKLNIASIAIFSEIDRKAKHVQMADESIYIGPALPAKSYINIPNIIEAIVKSKADAVHPGFGFLSENAQFASEVIKHGSTFIGPQPDSIEIMGNKITAKQIAEEHKINIVSGKSIANIEDAKQIAKKLGYPIMLKAALGGGGKGIRVVHNENEISNAFVSVVNEARNSFGNTDILLEKYIQNPRHIEIQILADSYGEVICLGERECSIQRRHQKIIEEAPSCFLDNNTRQKMYAQSIKIAKAINYQSAGTIEFIMDQEKNFYFLEMNTRLQVEHPVTEMITDIDLVEEMLKIAAGEALTLKQKDVKQNGWSMEARIYAENASFIPSIGTIQTYFEPEITKNVRVDSGIEEGDSINVFYDPMIAKLCVKGTNRNDAIKLMQISLNQFVIDGVENNIQFLSSVFHNKKFIAGDISTDFIKQEYSEKYHAHKPTAKILEEFLAVTGYLYIHNMQQNTPNITHRLVIQSQDMNYDIETSCQDNIYTTIFNRAAIKLSKPKLKIGRTILMQCHINDRMINIKIKMIKDYQYTLSKSGYEEEYSVFNQYTSKILQTIPFKTETKRVKTNEILSPISGVLTKIHASAGTKIQKGDPLFVVEAMKMENTICAEEDFTIQEIIVKEGEILYSGQAVFVIDE